MRKLSVIDVSHFHDSSINKNLIGDFLKLYMTELVTVPEQLKLLVLSKDYLGAEHLLHSFKGASDVVGAYLVAAAAHKLENFLKTANQQFDSALPMAEFMQDVHATQIGIKKMIAVLS